MKHGNYFLMMGFIGTGLLFTACLAVMIGPVVIKPLLVVKIWVHQFTGGLIEKEWSRIPEVIVMDIRTPRVLLSILVGMGLAVSGAAMQGLFRNPMAEPYVLGMSSGAAVGACLAIVLGMGRVFGPFAIPILAFTGATVTIFVVYNIARTGNRVPTETLLLAGIAVGLFLYAVVSFLKISASMENLQNVVLWLMGSFAMATWMDVKIVILPLLGGICVLCFMVRELDILQFGEETAIHLGMNVETVKRILLIASALVTGAAVSVSGIIGFVGLIVPHMVRMAMGSRHRILLPASALCGAIFLVCCDTLARVVSQPSEVPIGIITAAIGAPYFVYLLKRRKNAVNWW
ncbi:iron complex transport system permease protein [Desulfocicer vacuolatum DSM 3385]|uniref:Iron complex transport system permease protein n=1 Tax=Desulfocicer vacuolatum DSM 3385 TaxID=1121400 RepID=A0A1W2DDB3_9BACT|nr:iron chelate uptake ABC transporter family permease subunit [Desulfocicer vacuolatum]SMC95451.1 iron complex transport system permease protein [Desulfocicer vacuolatum DSM 3385]